jgi:predicted nucleic acid-binding protein
VLLLDSSIWIAAGAPTNKWHEPARQLVQQAPRPLGAIDLTLYEVANVVGVLDRNPDSAKTLAAVITRRCRGRLVSLDADLFAATVAAAAEHGITAYDAAYVAAARRTGWQLVSIDHRDLVSKGLAVTPDAALYP